MGAFMSGQCAVGIDLGGTNIKGGVRDEHGNLVVKDSIATEAEGGVDHVLGRMAGLVDDLLKRAGLDKGAVIGVGVGSPGPLSHTKGLIYHAPNLPGWVNVPIRARFAELTGLRVVLENDANAAAFGEYTAGAGQGVSDMVMLTLGTGIGGGVVLGGRLWRGVFDTAGEIGHTIVVPGGRVCPCGQRGCLERYSSAAAVAERLAEAVRAGEASSLRAKVEAGEPFDARDVLVALEAGDALAERVWDEACYYLAFSAVNLRHLINPELVVFAGGLINAGERLLGAVQAHFEDLSWDIAPDAPRLALATLGTDAGTVGAAALALGLAPPTPSGTPHSQLPSSSDSG